MAKKESEPVAAAVQAEPKKPSTSKERAAAVQAEGQKLWDKATPVTFVDADGSEYEAQICPLPTNKGVVIDVPQVQNPMEEFQKIAGLPLEKQTAAFAELNARMSKPSKAFSIGGNIQRLAEVNGLLCKSIEVGNRIVAAPDLLVDFGEKKGGVILKQRVRHQADVPQAAANSKDKIVPYFKFLAMLILMLCGSLFAADSGAVNEGKQIWAGKKIFLDRAPNVATLTGTTVLNFASNSVQVLDPGGASRDLTLPAVASSTGYEFTIVNTADAAENLVAKNVGGTTIVTIAQNEMGYVWCDGVTWYGRAFSAASSGFLPASGATTGATSQAQTFTNGVVLDSITGNTAASTFAYAGKVGASSAGQALTFTGGAGNGAFSGGAVSLLGGASGVGATGNGGAAALTAAASTATNGDGGAVTTTAGAGNGSGVGGANTQVAGAGGATGAGGTFTLTAGRGGSTSGAAGLMTVVAGAGGAGTTTTGAIASLTGGASGTGATGNGGISKIVGGAALSTNGNGGAGQVTGGIATGTGTGGALTFASGASAGAGGTAGSIAIDAGDEATGTRGTITIGGTEAGAIQVGRTGQTVTFPGTASFTVSPAGDGITKYIEVSLTNAQMLDLADTPVELIAAPGAGKMIEIDSVLFLFDYTAAYVPAGGDDLCINYENEAGMTIATGEATGFVDQTADVALIVNRAANVVPTKTVSENKAVVLCNEGSDFTGGNAANAVRVKIAYRTWATGF